MKEKVVHFLALGIISIIAATAVAEAAQNSLQRLNYMNQLQAKNIELQGVQQESTSLKSKVVLTQQQVEEKQKELSAKTDELTQKQTDLTKITKDLDSANKKIKDQQSQLSSNSDELSKLRDRPPLFDFKSDSTSLQNIDQKKQDVKDVVNAAYDIISDMYGKPYLLHSVTIDFVDSFTNNSAAAEIVISNGSDGLSETIKLKDFNKNNFDDVNAVIHEIIHSFHGLAVLPTYPEEGITVATTDLVMEKLITNKKIPNFDPLYIRISYDDYINSSVTIPSDIYSSDKVSDIYQLGGYGWYQIAKADSNFLKTFNEKIYAQKHDGNEITASAVKQAIKDSTSVTVHDKSIANWLQTKGFAF